MNMETKFMITSIERVILVGIKEYPEKTTTFTHELNSNELIFHFSGNSTVYFNDDVFDIKENTLRFLPKGKFNKYVVDREKHGECIVVYFSTDKPVSDQAFIHSVENNSVIPTLFRKIFSLWVSKREGYYYECISVLYKIIAEMQKTNYIPERKYLHIKPAIDYIHSNFMDKPITTNNLTDLCGISYAYIQKLFIQKFGISPKTYVLQLKLNYAGELLNSGLYTPTQVASLCGYDNISLFYRQFKKYYSLTPSQYIKKHKTSK